MLSMTWVGKMDVKWTETSLLETEQGVNLSWLWDVRTAALTRPSPVIVPMELVASRTSSSVFECSAREAYPLFNTL